MGGVCGQIMVMGRPHREMLTATDRYLARLIALPMLGTLVISAMLLVLDKMLSLFDFVAAEGGPVSVVWRMLANMMLEYRRSEEHTSELQSLMRISYAVFCLKKTQNKNNNQTID